MVNPARDTFTKFYGLEVCNIRESLGMIALVTLYRLNTMKSLLTNIICTIIPQMGGLARHRHREFFAGNGHRELWSTEPGAGNARERKPQTAQSRSHGRGGFQRSRSCKKAAPERIARATDKNHPGFPNNSQRCSYKRKSYDRSNASDERSNHVLWTKESQRRKVHHFKCPPCSKQSR